MSKITNVKPKIGLMHDPIQGSPATRPLSGRAKSLADRFYKDSEKYAFKMKRKWMTPDDTRDVAADAVMRSARAWKKRHEFGFKKYLYKCVKGVIIDMWRKRFKSKRSVLLIVDSSFMDSIPSSH